MTIHPGTADLNNLLDGSGDGQVLAHLAGCPACRRRYEELQLVDEALRSLEPEKAPAAFTAGVMARMRRPADVSFAWSVLRNLAPLLALAVVATVVVVVFAGAAGTTAHPAIAPAAQALDAWLAALGEWMRPLMTQRVYGVAAALVALFAAVGLFDRYVLMRLWRRHADHARAASAGG